MKKPSNKQLLLAISFIFLGSVAMPLTALSQTREIFYGYDYWFKQFADQYMEKVERNYQKNHMGALLNGPQCQSFMDSYIRDGLIDIRYSFGYFDDSTGESISWSGKNWGLSPSADEGAFLAMRKILLEECSNLERRLCGFSELTNEHQRVQEGKSILARKMQIHGKEVEVRITMTFASASPYFKKNLSELSLQQRKQTRISEEEFFSGVHEADFVFYNGHSRNGGGPDFNPPKLTSYNKTDYKGYYQKVRPGINRLTSEIKKSSRKDVFVGMFSCDSRLHFRRRLLAANPSQRMVLTANHKDYEDVSYADTFKASVAYLEGLLRGGCYVGLDRFALVEDKLEKTFFSFNLK